MPLCFKGLKHIDPKHTDTTLQLQPNNEASCHSYRVTLHTATTLTWTLTLINPLKPNSSNYYTLPYSFNFWHSGTLALKPWAPECLNVGGGIARILLKGGHGHVPNFVSFVTSVAELAHGEKTRTQSLTQSPSLFDALETSEYSVLFKGLLCVPAASSTVAEWRQEQKHRLQL